MIDIPTIPERPKIPVRPNLRVKVENKEFAKAILPTPITSFKMVAPVDLKEDNDQQAAETESESQNMSSSTVLHFETGFRKYENNRIDSLPCGVNAEVEFNATGRCAESEITDDLLPKYCGNISKARYSDQITSNHKSIALTSNIEKLPAIGIDGFSESEQGQKLLNVTYLKNSRVKDNFCQLPDLMLEHRRIPDTFSEVSSNMTDDSGEPRSCESSCLFPDKEKQLLCQELPHVNILDITPVKFKMGGMINSLSQGEKRVFDGISRTNMNETSTKLSPETEVLTNLGGEGLVNSVLNTSVKEVEVDDRLDLGLAKSEKYETMSYDSSPVFKGKGKLQDSIWNINANSTREMGKELNEKMSTESKTSDVSSELYSSVSQEKPLEILNIERSTSFAEIAQVKANPNSPSENIDYKTTTNTETTFGKAKVEPMHSHNLESINSGVETLSSSINSDSDIKVDSSMASYAEVSTVDVGKLNNEEFVEKEIAIKPISSVSSADSIKNIASNENSKKNAFTNPNFFEADPIKPKPADNSPNESLSLSENSAESDFRKQSILKTSALEKTDHSNETSAFKGINSQLGKPKQVPIVPKKPSSKIAAFQEMLTRQQVEYHSSKPFDEQLGSIGLKRFGSSRASFAQNLNVLFAGPAKMLNHKSAELNKKAFNTSVEGAIRDTNSKRYSDLGPHNKPHNTNIPQNRARGPQSRKLPSFVTNVEKINSTDKNNKIVVFNTWSVVFKPCTLTKLNKCAGATVIGALAALDLESSNLTDSKTAKINDALLSGIDSKTE